MLLSEELWQANKDIVHSCFHSSFIQSSRNGQLDNEHFIQYLAQDAFLLEAMAPTLSRTLMNDYWTLILDQPVCES